MKITDIEYYPLQLTVAGDSEIGTDEDPSRQVGASAESMAAQRYKAPETGVILIRTDDGLVGIGDGATLPHYLGHGIGSMVDWMARFRTVLIGADPLNIAGIHQLMEAVADRNPAGCRPAQAAIDMAIYDLAGKAHNCPVFDLLGGAYRTSLDLQTQMHGQTPEQQLEVCRHYIDKGYKALKVKIGGQIRRDGCLTSSAVLADQAKVEIVAQHVPHNIQVDVDANQTLSSPKTAISFFEGVLRSAHHPNMSIEQPLHHLDLVGHAFMRRALPLPMILDESVTSPAAMMQIVRLDAADRIVLKPNRVGGLFQAQKIISICEANGIGVSLDTMPFTVLGNTMLCHLAATIKTHYPLDAEGHTFFEESPFHGGLTLSNGQVHISREAGFGVEIDEQKLENMKCKI
ncbi:MAG: mandelate racemase/muconate lactonizing enzyme family protein [Bacteroidetes Order II. Incertae sedis bacterium]|jgi:L-alanine-DL-glutamate epimerase-like enolase superfamily enzyme|nr:mandelate racemase/muconate lactonizing enzyme family protein [Bacteroidetes Order II. bacterium]MBT4051795.1 mandelate racemase/muconate lactonizing enzyme family protein [Bacteroidetes Order II. bacterium]MBT4601932.1 mandelate racemase/muconate lactonizing enzyme family protein [Bacteroidetes Order II. bacterium]MBT5249163.1 mandelate racemase/muconate lactonizing enzyme family protein [Bacteroidetes Order II. bacterium]MBT6199525.1 mandelate racemase/muconate lactonizing enzyme family pr